MDKKVFIIGGHYGSGKTEVSLNLALENRAERTKVALIDLDIANPYFRSREKIEEFSKYGIDIFGNFFRDEVYAGNSGVSGERSRAARGSGNGIDRRFRRRRQRGENPRPIYARDRKQGFRVLLRN